MNKKILFLNKVEIKSDEEELVDVRKKENELGKYVKK